MQINDARIEERATVINRRECREFRQVYASLDLCSTTAYVQFRKVVIDEHECTCAKLNGSQFRQGYLSLFFWHIHP